MGVLKTEEDKKGFFSLMRYDRGIHDDKNGGDRRQKRGGRIQDSKEEKVEPEDGKFKEELVYDKCLS